MFNKYVIILSVIFTSSVFGSMSMLHHRYGTKAVAMGGAFTAMEETADTLFYNWSKINTFEKNNFSIQHTLYLDTPVYTFAWRAPFNQRSFGIGAIYSEVSDLQHTSLNELNQPQLENKLFNQRIGSIFITARKKILTAHVGIKFGWFEEKIKSTTGKANYTDIALQKSFHLFNAPTNFGLTIKNIFSNKIKWNPGQSQFEPYYINAGVATVLNENRLQLATDIERNSSTKKNKLFLGAEYWLHGTKKSTPSCAARVGLKNNNFTAGVGLLISNIRLDYAFIEQSILANYDNHLGKNQHLFSIGYDFSAFKKSNIKKKQDPYKIDSIVQHLLKEESFNRYQTKHNKKVTSISKITLNKNTKLINYTQQEKTKTTSIYINQNNISKSNTSISTKLPLKWLMKLDNSNEVMIMDIHKNNQDYLTLSGFIPTDHVLLANGRILNKNQNNGAFFYKISLAELEKYDLEFVLIKK